MIRRNKKVKSINYHLWQNPMRDFCKLDQSWSAACAPSLLPATHLRDRFPCVAVVAHILLTMKFHGF
jgi:hypothetical protein